MSIGPALRRLMPPALERKAAGIYRAVFVDLRKVAACLSGHLPANAKLLDIGGGDGELLNHLLRLRPDISVTMVDVAESVGNFVAAEYRKSISFHPRTSLEEHLAGRAETYDAVLISDVMHHLPSSYRGPFLQAVHRAIRLGGAVFIKDVQPGHVIAGLSLFCDKYISGDRGVKLVSRAELQSLANTVLPPHCATELGLFAADRPNYLVRLEFGAAGPATSSGREVP